MSYLTYVSGYGSYAIDEIWYQQYYTNQTHGWHTHGSNFTGVYYIELDDGPKTQLVDPLNHNKLLPIDCTEGSLIIFPSYVIHRSPKVYNDKRKTIISFNWNTIAPHKNTLERLKQHDNV